MQTDHSQNKDNIKTYPNETILDRLRQPLDMCRVKRRQAPGQGTVPYLEGFDVIEVANDIFNFCWSFDLISEPQIMRWDRVVTNYDQRSKKKMPVLAEDGKTVTENVGLVYVTGRVMVEMDGKAYYHADAGRCIFTGDLPESLDTAIAGAVTDCLKRCFRQLGEQFGNSLYDKEIARHAGAKGSPGNEPEGRHRVQGGPACSTETPTGAADQEVFTPEAASAIPCPFGTTQNPHLKGMKLGEIARLEAGPKVLAYLADQWLAPDVAGQQAKMAARLLLSPAAG